MFKFFLRSVFRSIVHQKLYTSINVIGLVIGIISFAMIMLYVNDESHFDEFHSKRDRIYRLTSANKQRAGGITPYVWGLNIKNDFPEVENYTTFQILSLVTKLDDVVLSEDKVITADSTFFEIFDFPVLQGNKKEFLKHPNKIIITPQTSMRYYKGENPIGKTLEMNLFGTFVNFEIAGVVECPSNSHIQFDFIIPIHLVKQYSKSPWAYEHWRAHFVYTYLLMEENASLDGIHDKFGDFLLNHAGEEVRDAYTPDIQPLIDIYLKSDLTFDFQPRGNIQNVKILRFVAIGILLIALINFINITSAQSLRRAKEVGLKRLLGTRRISLIIQFIGESTVISLIAAILSAGIIAGILQYFNNFTGKTFELGNVFTLENILLLLLLSLFVGVVSGFYPALLLSSYKTASILTSRSASKSKGALARKIMVTIQFSLASILLISTGVIYNQVQYMRNKDLGFDKEQVLAIDDGGEVSSSPNKMQLLREQLISDNNILTVSGSSTYPGQQTWALRYYPEGHEGEEGFSISTIFSDHDFLQTYGVKIVTGRDFNRDIYSDSSAFLINEAAVGLFANVESTWKDDPIGKELTYAVNNKKYRIIGVFKNFNYESLKSEINPLIIQLNPEDFNSIQMRLSLSNVSKSIAKIRSTWQRLFPQVPFNYRFVDDEFDTLFKEDQQLGKILQAFALLSISIAVLGLFGLASFLAFEKAKEMSIRKVIGASEKQLTILLAWLFLRLVIVANILALPLGYFLMNKWLEDFVYRDAMPYSVFLLAVASTLLVTVLTVAYHAIRTAVVNPVTVLAQE